MSKDLAHPYEGDQPYLFVSYCHKDKESVLPVLRFLQDEGIRIWYDTGIDPGTEWPEVIADHLDQSSVFLAFISPNSLESHNCRKEFNFAMMKNILSPYCDFGAGPVHSGDEITDGLPSGYLLLRVSARGISG